MVDNQEALVKVLLSNIYKTYSGINQCSNDYKKYYINGFIFGWFHLYQARLYAIQNSDKDYMVNLSDDYLNALISSLCYKGNGEVGREEWKHSVLHGFYACERRFSELTLSCECFYDLATLIESLKSNVSMLSRPNSFASRITRGEMVPVTCNVSDFISGIFKVKLR